MDFVSNLVKTLFDKELSPTYAFILLAYYLAIIIFVIWAIYYATVKKAAAELPNITWLSLKDTIKYTSITLFSIVIFSSILFVYDFGLDQLVNLVIENAK